MEDLALHYFPYPHFRNGEGKSGLLVPLPARCTTCDRRCVRETTSELKLCSYGLNFYRADENFLIVGIVVKDFPTSTPAHRKMLKQLRHVAISREDLEAVVGRVYTSVQELADDLQRRRDAVVNEYRASGQYQDDVVKLLKPHLKETFAPVHDYKQFVRKVLQNLDVILDQRYPGKPLEEKVEMASHEEKAIYWAAQLMDQKLDGALFLMDPELINTGRKLTRYHGAVTKYLRIYERTMEENRIHLSVNGESRDYIEANPRAITMIPHAMIDNAIKYAPRGSTVTIEYVKPDVGLLLFRVISLGPRIHSDEKERIFEPFYRGTEAKRLSPEGTGFGLYQAQFVAKKLGTSISVEQDNEPSGRGMYQTTFGVTFETIAASEPSKKSRTIRKSSGKA